VDFVHRQEVGLVMFDVAGVLFEPVLARHLERNVRRVFVVNTIAPMGYRIVRSLRHHVHAVVGVSPRVTRDLTRYCRCHPDWTMCIPNAVDISSFQAARRSTRGGEPLRVLFLGRVEDTQKGVLWLPQILQRASENGADVRLTVAGDGPDLPELCRRLSSRGLLKYVQILGWVPPEQVAGRLSDHDVVLMPSRFEGFGRILIEGMAAGCVPVASRIRGVTDFIVEHGRTGFLFPLGAVGTAADHLARLHRDREVLDSMSTAARIAVAARFSVLEQARRYAELLRHVMDAPRPIADPLPLTDWKLDRRLTTAWWTRLPPPLKNALRLVRERIG
jgi:glycosyltransferase involved in cell wall biosynthesis